MDKTKIPFDRKFELYRRDEKKSHPAGLSVQNGLEIRYCLEGEGYLVTDDLRLKIQPGAFYLMNGQERVTVVSVNHLKWLIVRFHPSLVVQGNPLHYCYLQPFYQNNPFLKTDEGMSERLGELLFAMEGEAREKQKGYPMLIQALLMQFLGTVYRNGHEEEQDDIDKRVQRLKPCLDYIESHYGEERFSLDALASMVHMNRTYFCAYFKKTMQTGVSDYINRLRIERACMLLAGTQQTVIKIAMECGFENISYFNRRFKQQTGFTPIQYRKQCKS